ncbi:MAG: GNAT family N-acetyltransferase [Christensenellaceae bacterium]|jgi:GNAT superfamily N-acetyltransferase|nr:GNAT family N-acetyltransferase [Christensenellaceae bacterium]
MDLYTYQKKLCAFSFKAKEINEPLIITQFLWGNNIITSAYPEDAFGEELFNIKAGRKARIPAAIATSQAIIQDFRMKNFKLLDEEFFPKSMGLKDLNTKEGYRGMGIGGELFELTAQECFERKLSRMFWTSLPDADKFYEEHGAEPYKKDIYMYTYTNMYGIERTDTYTSDYILDTSKPRTFASQPNPEFDKLIRDNLPKFNAENNITLSEYIHLTR